MDKEFVIYLSAEVTFENNEREVVAFLGTLKECKLTQTGFLNLHKYVGAKVKQEFPDKEAKQIVLLGFSNLGQFTQEEWADYKGEPEEPEKAE